MKKVRFVNGIQKIGTQVRVITPDGLTKIVSSNPELHFGETRGFGDMSKFGNEQGEVIADLDLLSENLTNKTLKGF